MPRFLSRLLMLALLPAALFPSVHAQALLPTTQLTAGIHVIQAEIAATPAARQQGLMYRSRLGPNDGMLFVFEEKAGHCFWMKNTLIPLSIAFLGDDGAIVNIEDMQPQSEASHCPTSAVRFALEMNRGWFKQRGLKPGIRINGLPRH